MNLKSYALLVGLIVSGVVLEAKSYRYQTVDLFEAVKKGNRSDTKRYLKSGVDVNALDQEDKTVLDYAAEKENSKIIRMLLKAGSKATNQENAQKVKQVLKKYVRRFFWISLGLFALLIPIGIWGSRGPYGWPGGLARPLMAGFLGVFPLTLGFIVLGVAVYKQHYVKHAQNRLILV